MSVSTVTHNALTSGLARPDRLPLQCHPALWINGVTGLFERLSSVTTRRFGMLLGAAAAALTLSAANGTVAAAATGGHLWNNTAAVNQCLGVLSDQVSANTIMWTCNGNNDQQWRFDWDSLGSKTNSYSILDANDSCLTGYAKGSTVYATPCGTWPAKNAQWTTQLETCDSHYCYYEIVNNNTGLCLSVAGGSTANGATPIVWTCQDTADQQWGGPATSTML